MAQMTLNGMKRILGDFFFFFFSYEKLSFWNCRHVLRVWDHAHRISGEILPHFDPSHLSVAQRDQKLENHVSTRDRHVTDTCHVSGTMPIGFLVKFYPILTPHTCL